MHYFCGGGGSFTLNLSDVDKVGHRKLYGPTSGSTGFQFKRYVRVRFEGPEVTKTMPEVLGVLTRQGLIETKSHTVSQAGESLRSIFAENLEFPFVSPAFINYAETLNKGTSSKLPLKSGEEIQYPNITLKPFDKLVVLNPNDQKDAQTYKEIKASWPSALISEVRKGESTLALFLKTFELVLEFDSREKEIQAREELLIFKNETKSKYSVFGGATPSSKQFPLYALGPIEANPLVTDRRAHPATNTAIPLPESSKQTAIEFLNLVRTNLGRVRIGVEGDLSLYFGEMNYPDPPAPCERNAPPICPEIILIDAVVSKHPDIPWKH